jgi:2-oxoglutarate ferredoxin oxidoreductase subunit gamma
MKAQHERYEIRIAGYGGQGVVTIGRILGRAFSVHQGINTVNTQSYGPESRGGACRSEVVVSSGVIQYPYVREADCFVALSQLALDRYGSSLKPDGLLLVEADSVAIAPADIQGKLFAVPTLEIARETGHIKFQNSVALGALYWLIQDRIAEESLKKALAESVPRPTLAANSAAFDRGRQYLQTRATQQS